MLRYRECSFYHLLGDSNSLIPVGLSLSLLEKVEEKKRVTGKVSETSFACVFIAVIGIGDSNSRINKNLRTISYWGLFV